MAQAVQDHEFRIFQLTGNEFIETRRTAAVELARQHQGRTFDLVEPRLTLLSVDFLYSAAGPHTAINGKEVVNFASANYLGLIGNEQIAVRRECDVLTVLLYSSGISDQCD